MRYCIYFKRSIPLGQDGNKVGKFFLGFSLYDGYRRAVKTQFWKNYRRVRVLGDGGERGEGGREEQLSRLTVGQDLPHVLKPSLHQAETFLGFCREPLCNKGNTMISQY
jgi:hypothetical protein